MGIVRCHMKSFRARQLHVIHLPILVQPKMKLAIAFCTTLYFSLHVFEYQQTLLDPLKLIVCLTFGWKNTHIQCMNFVLHFVLIFFQGSMLCFPPHAEDFENSLCKTINFQTAFLCLALFCLWKSNRFLFFQTIHMQQSCKRVRVPAGNSTTRVMKMLPGYPFKPLNNSVSS